MQLAAADIAGDPLQGVRFAPDLLHITGGHGRLQFLQGIAVTADELAQQSSEQRPITPHTFQPPIHIQAGQLPGQVIGWIQGPRAGSFTADERLLVARCRQPALQGSEQHGRIDRLGDVIVHAGIEAPFALTGHCVRRHRDDRQLGKRRHLTDLRSRFIAVHLGHLDIHQHQIEGMPLQHRQRILAVARRADQQPHVLQQLARHLLIDQVVFNQQDVAGETVLHRGSRCGLG